MNEAKLFERFADRIKALPQRDEYTEGDLLSNQFRLYEDDSLAIYYAPFDYVNSAAQVVIVGITPGWTQMKLSYREARRALLEGVPCDEVNRRAKALARFAGRMRSNLVQMLDGIGLHRSLELQTCGDLFDSASAQLHSTSAIRYPVFVDGKNYTGHRPKLLRTPVLRDFIYTCLKDELNQVPNALLIPLGNSVDSAIEDLISSGMLDRQRCLVGFPHPSPGNGHRIRLFVERRAALRRDVDAWFSRTK